MHTSCDRCSAHLGMVASFWLIRNTLGLPRGCVHKGKVAAGALLTWAWSRAPGPPNTADPMAGPGMPPRLELAIWLNSV
eukprot:1137037-Pelagomonas_calceolata.AAC.2